MTPRRTAKVLTAIHVAQPRTNEVRLNWSVKHARRMQYKEFLCRQRAKTVK